MARITFPFNSIVKIRGEFRTPKTAIPASELIDPAIVTLTILKPDKTSEVRTYGVSGIDRTDIGKYVALLTLDQEGTYHWRYKGDNGPAAIGIVTGTLDSVREPDF